MQGKIIQQKSGGHVTGFCTIVAVKDSGNPNQNILGSTLPCSLRLQSVLQRVKLSKEYLLLSENRDAYRERECGDQEHKEDGPLGICGGLEGQPCGNEHPQCGSEKEKANSNEDIWGTETQRELLLVCKPSNTWKIPLRNSPRKRRR